MHRHTPSIATLFAASALLASADLHAQDVVPPPPTTSEPAPPARPPPAEVMPPPAEVAPTTSTPPPTDHRPRDQFAIGLGAGWVFPSEILTPNTASARFLFPGSVTIEPFVSIGSLHQETVSVVESPEPGVSSDNEATSRNLTFGGGTAVRVPVMRRGNLDLQVLGNLSAIHTIGLPDDDAAAVTSSDATSVGLGYGLGIEWFFLPNMAFSADALNPLLSLNRSATTTTRDVTFIDEAGETQTGTQTSSDSSLGFSVGAIWQPSVRAMVHLYF